MEEFFRGVYALITTILGTGISVRSIVADHQDNPPFVILNEITRIPSAQLGGPADVDQVRLQVDIYTAGDECMKIAKNLRRGIEAWPTNEPIDGVKFDGIRLLNQYTLPDDDADLNRITQEYDVRHCVCQNC